MLWAVSHICFSGCACAGHHLVLVLMQLGRISCLCCSSSQAAGTLYVCKFLCCSGYHAATKASPVMAVQSMPSTGKLCCRSVSLQVCVAAVDRSDGTMLSKTSPPQVGPRRVKAAGDLSRSELLAVMRRHAQVAKQNASTEPPTRSSSRKHMFVNKVFRSHKVE